jgi:hypothetical protein
MDLVFKRVLLHLTKGIETDWPKDYGHRRKPRYTAAVRDALHALPEPIVHSIACMARMGSTSAFEALRWLRQLNTTFRDLVDMHMTPFIPKVPTNTIMCRPRLVAFYLQARWMREHPGVDIPAVAWSAWRTLDDYHARATRSGRTYTEIRRDDEALVRAVMRMGG